VTDELTPEQERASKARSAALQIMYQAMNQVSMLMEDPEHITEQPIWRGATSKELRARPATRLQVAVMLRQEASRQIDHEIRTARGAGVSWQEIAVLLDLVDADHPTPYDQAVAAYERASGSDQWHNALFMFECDTCGAKITDHGPYEFHPLDQETGHDETCARILAAVAAYKKRIGDDE
jgi:hypothetical protein